MDIIDIENTKKTALCPKCQKQTLSFNQESGKMKCSNCGFEEQITKEMK